MTLPTACGDDDDTVVVSDAAGPADAASGADASVGPDAAVDAASSDGGLGGAGLPGADASEADAQPSASDAPVGAFTVSLQPTRLRATPATNQIVDVTVTRSGGFTGPITLTVRDLPDKVTAEPVTIPAGMTTARLSIRPAADVVPTGAASRVRVEGNGGGLTQTVALDLELFGRSGTLDATFNRTGVALLDAAAAESEIHAVAVRTDGKVLVAGGSAAGPFITRLLVDGTVDTSFAAQGHFRAELPGGAFTAISVQANNQIVVAGHAPRVSRDALVMRLQENGAIDPLFGRDGMGRTFVDIGSEETVSGLAVRSDGKLLVSGGTTAGGGQLFLVRLKTTGEPDESFYADGAHEFPVGAQPKAGALRVQADGGIVLFASAGAPADVVILRLKPDGEVDSGFGTAGLLTLPITADNDVIYGATIDAMGRLIVGGLVDTSNAQLFVARLTPQGMIDTTFGVGGAGKAFVSLGAGTVPTAGLALAGRSILVAGQTPVGGLPSVFVAKLADNGTPDTTFGTSAVATTTLGSAGANARAVAAAPDGRIVLAGAALDGSTRKLAIVRYWP